MLVSWRWCCHCFYGKFWRHDVRQQDLNFHIWQALCPLVPARRCCVATRRETAAPVPWPQDQIGAVATRRRPFAAKTCGCKYMFFPCVFLGWRSNNVNLTSTMLRLLYQQSSLYEVVNTSTTNRVDWNEFEQTNVPGEGLELVKLVADTQPSLVVAKTAAHCP